jgi:UDP-N-acetylmuramate dehydrogenase
MMPQAKTTSLIQTLPPVSGRYEEAADLSNMVWFRTGGAAEVLFRPKDLADLKSFLEATPTDLPITLVGVGSNLLIRDKGVEGVVIKLGKPFANITIDDGLVTAGAGAMDVTVAFAAAEASLSGLEFLRGIPGTIGGALRMNAGAYGTEVADVLVSATAIDRDGVVHTLSAKEMGFSYRKSSVPSDWIFLSASFRGTPGDKTEIQEKMDAIQQAREDTQPMRVRTGGSTFKNPEGKKAWQLIEEAGCRGLTIGGASVSEKHCNFLINSGEATSQDLETLGETVKQKVLEKTGVDLQWEIKRVGKV